MIIKLWDMYWNGACWTPKNEWGVSFLIKDNAVLDADTNKPVSAHYGNGLAAIIDDDGSLVDNAEDIIDEWVKQVSVDDVRRVDYQVVEDDEVLLKSFVRL